MVRPPYISSREMDEVRVLYAAARFKLRIMRQLHREALREWRGTRHEIVRRLRRAGYAYTTIRKQLSGLV